MSITVTTLEQVRALTGSDLGVSDWFLVDQDRVQAFADAGDDHHWVHVDPQRATNGPFGGPIVHANLTLSLIVPLFDQLLHLDDGGETMFYGLNRVRFPAPVAVGRRIRLRGRVAETREINGAIELTVDFTVEVENSDKPGCVAQSVWRHFPGSDPRLTAP